MKLIKKIVGTVIVLSLPLTAEQVPSTKELLHIIEQLKARVAKLEASQKRAQTAQKRMEAELLDLSDYTEATETKVLEDKLKFGFGFKTNLDNFHKNYVDGHRVDSDNIWSTKLMLNMRANLTDTMKFHGRLSMYKYWGSSVVHPYTYYDNMQGRVPADSALYVERAYLDLFFNRDGKIPFALTIGRQPSTDGPSQQFKDNTARKATYSALLYDGASDGAVATWDLSRLLKRPKTYFRLGYAKGFGYTETANDVGNAFVGASNTDLKDTNVVGAFFDTTLPGVRHSLFQVSYSRLFDIIANPLDANSSRNVNIGDMDMLGAMAEVTNLKDWGVDLFAHYGYVLAHPNGKGYLRYGTLLGQKGTHGNKRGFAVWVGGRYGFGEGRRYKLGLEYNHGSRNWVSLTQGSFDVYNKLATRGDAFEGYVMYVLNRYTNFRLGYVDIRYNYTRSGWFVGRSVDVDSTTQPSSELKRLQSIYLKMSVNY